MRVRPDLIRILFEETFSCEKPPDTNGRNVSVGQNDTFESKMDVLFQKAFEMCFGDFSPNLRNSE